MILVVDDQADIREFLTTVLTGAGHVVNAFADPAAALDFARANAPQLIISDMVMPEMDGLAFRAAYLREFPQRQTPFVFLSSQGDPATVVKGLTTGADDYLIKPLHPEILKAKVSNLLGRRPPAAETPIFHGDLAKFPLAKIMQFCETRSLTGTVAIPVGDRTARLRFTGGQIDLDSDAEESELFDRLYDLEEGTFSIIPQQVDFSSLADVAVTTRSTPAAEVEKPMGKLSGVKLNQRLFQIQTEFVTYPEHQILSVVILDGKVLVKRGRPTTATDRESLARLIEEQHQQVEAEVREKTLELVRSKQADEESPREKFGRLLEAGFDHYRNKEYQAAFDCWSDARKIDPENKTIATNLAIVRKKLETA